MRRKKRARREGQRSLAAEPLFGLSIFDTLILTGGAALTVGAKKKGLETNTLRVSPITWSMPTLPFAQRMPPVERKA